MKILVLDKFFSSVPSNKVEKVKQKIKDLVSELEESGYNFKGLSSGWGYRAIKITNRLIHKVRIDESNRILFSFGGKFYPSIREEYKESLVLLEYCDHDSQIRAAVSRDFEKQGISHYTIDTSIVAEEDEERIIDFSLENSIIAITDVDYLEEIFGEDGRYYYLNNHQYDIVRFKDKGEFILGSAGSGKTTIGIHKLIQYIKMTEHSDSKICYFTFSTILKDKTMKVFKELAQKLYGLDNKSINRVDFFTVEEFLEQSSEHEVKIISFYKFKEWYERQLRQRFDVVSLWKERRGIIKGIIGSNWQYETHISIQNFNNEHLVHLDEKGFIKLNMEEKVFNICKDLNEVCKEVRKIGIPVQRFREDIIKEYNKKISTQIEMTREQYLELKGNYSSFAKEDREEVYHLFEKFTSHAKTLRKDGFIEEGDLVRGILKDINPRYDYIVIDEIQDLTEIQVYLLSQLLINKKNILVSGDFHQNVHPTFFKDGRIESIFQFLDGGSNFEISRLNENYRSSKDIVQLANQVAIYRNEVLPSKVEDKILEVAKRNQIKKPYLYTGRKEMLWDCVKDKSYVSIVVANEFVKDRLNRQYPELKARVFTVSEIKGIERKYIITYNIISEYKEQWKIITNGQKLNMEMYRYYFNLLYVAITRARDMLGMVEDDIPQEIKGKLLNQVDTIELFDIEKLALQDISSVGEAMKVAIDNEYNRAFEQAISEYERLIKNEDATQSDREMARIGKERCMIKKEYESTRNKEKCSMSLIKLGEYDEAIKYLRDTNNVVELFKSIILAKNSYDLPKELEKFKVNPLQLLIEINDQKITERFLNSEYNEINNFSIQIEEIIHRIHNFPNPVVFMKD